MKPVKAGRAKGDRLNSNKLKEERLGEEPTLDNL